jgi:hypothetical protein
VLIKVGGINYVCLGELPQSLLYDWVFMKVVLVYDIYNGGGKRGKILKSLILFKLFFYFSLYYILTIE